MHVILMDNVEFKCGDRSNIVYYVFVLKPNFITYGKLLIYMRPSLCPSVRMDSLCLWVEHVCNLLQTTLA